MRKKSGETLYPEYVKIALDAGAAEAKIIEASTIKTASWTRLRCQYGCSSYGTNLCCPPYTPTAEEMQKAIDDYRYAMLVRFKTLGEAKRVVPAIERAIFLDGKYKAFGLKGGGCGLCEKCNLNKCVHPQEARPSLEASGIDVYETVRRNGFHIEVLRDKDARGAFFGLILIE